MSYMDSEAALIVVTIRRRNCGRIIGSLHSGTRLGDTVLVITLARNDGRGSIKELSLLTYYGDGFDDRKDMNAVGLSAS